MRRRALSRIVPCALLAACLLCDSAFAILTAGVRLRVDADRRRVPADGQTAVTISVEVLDASGAPVPDGTLVHFSTTLGEVVSPVQALGGFAQTVLTPSTTSGSAQVSVMVGATRETIEIDFLASSGSAAPGSGLVELRAEDLAYDPAHSVFIGAGQASVTYQGLTLTADALKYEVSASTICAQGNVVLRSGRHELTCDALTYRLQAQQGRLIRASEGSVERLVVQGELLQTRPDPDADPGLWGKLDTGQTRTWIKAKSALIQPGKRIILDDAAVYVDDSRVISLRRHVMGAQAGQSIFGNTFGFNSGGGVNLDLPYYYRANRSGVGSLHLMCNRSALGGIGYEPGWALGLRQEYLRDGRIDGSLTISDVLHPRRGLALDHRQRLGAGNLDFDLSSAAYDDGGPSLHAGSASYFLPLPSGKLSLIASGTMFGGSRSSLMGASYRLSSRALGSGVLLTPSFSLKQSRQYAGEPQTYVDPVTGEPIEIQQRDYASTSLAASLSFDLANRKLDPKTQFDASLVTGLSQGFSGALTSALDGRFSLMRRTNTSDYLRLSYSYSGGSLQPTLFATSRQRLALGGRATINACALSFNLSRDLSGARVFGTASLTTPLPFGTDSRQHPLWNLDISHVFSRLEHYGFVSTRLAISRSLGRYRLALCYSPQGRGGYDSRPWVGLDGYGYTYSGGRRFWVEMMSAGF